MDKSKQKFDELTWIEVMHQIEKTYSLLTQNQEELEDKNKSLAVAQEFLSSIMKSMTDVLLVCDKDGLIIQCNYAFEVQLKTNEKKLINQHFTKVIKLNSKSLQSLNQYQNLNDINIDIKLGNSNKVEKYNINCCIRRDIRSRILGYVFIGRPIGELIRAHDNLRYTHAQLRKSQNQLIESEKMASLGRLVSGIAHEINNPISFVYGNVYTLNRFFEQLKQQILAKSHAIPNDIQAIFNDLPELMEGTIEGLDRVTDIITGLRNFSTIYKEQTHNVELFTIIKTAILWTQKSHHIVVKVENKVQKNLTVKANAGKLHQLFANLLQNSFYALKTTDNPNLLITSVIKNKHIKINLIDNGVGIEQEKLSKIFDPFYSTRETGEGMGLGLYICYNITQEFGGSLFAKINVKQGMTFTVLLPLIEDENA